MLSADHYRTLIFYAFWNQGSELHLQKLEIWNQQDATLVTGTHL